MKVLIIYCHPSKNSFTYEVKEAFIKGLESAGHSYEVSVVSHLVQSDLFCYNITVIITSINFQQEKYHIQNRGK